MRSSTRRDLPSLLARFGRLALVVAAGGWLGAVASAEDAPKVTYDDDVSPIFRQHCSNCHNADKKAGGLNVTTYTNLMEGGSSGEVVTPGDASGSYLFDLVTHKSEPKMPPNSEKMPEAQLATIQKWIDGGLLESKGSKAKMSNKPKVSLALGAPAAGKPEGPPPMPGKLPLEPVVRTSRANAVTAMAASPWAPLLAVGAPKQVLLYNTDTLELIGVLPFPEGQPHVLKFSRNSKLLLAGGGRGSYQGKCIVFNVETGERLFDVGNEFDVVLAADIDASQKVIALGGPGKIVRLFSTADGSTIAEIKKHTDWITALEFSPDGVLLATGDRNGGLHVWEAQTGRAYLDLPGHTGTITDISWRLDSNLVSSCSEDGTARLWEMENGGQVKNWGVGGGAQSIRYAKNGQIATCGRDNTPKLWNGDGGQIRPFAGLPDVAMRVAFSHDDKRVFAGDWTGQIVCYNAEDAKLVGTLTTNPPTLAERIATAEGAINAAKAAAATASQTAQASQAAADKLAADLAAQQKAKADFDAASVVAKQAADAHKAAYEQAVAQKGAAEKKLAGLKPLAQSTSALLAQAQKAAADAGNEASLVEAAKRIATEAETLNKQSAETEKQVNDLAAAAQGQQTAQQTAEKQYADAIAASQAAQKNVEAITPQVEPAKQKAAADRAAFDASAGAVQAAEADLAKWKEAVAFAAEAKKAAEQTAAAQ